MLKLSLEFLENCTQEEQEQAFIWLFAIARNNGVLHQWEAKARIEASGAHSGETVIPLEEKKDKPQNKIKAIKSIRDIFGIFLQEAKDQVEAGKLCLPKGLTTEAFNALEKELDEAGYIIVL